MQLTERQATALRSKAARKGVSVAELVRQAVDESLAADEGRVGDRSAWDRAIAAAGCVDSGLGDLARNHDRYLEEAYSR